MGCYLSKNGAHDANARLFRVFIVNDLWPLRKTCENLHKNVNENMFSFTFLCNFSNICNFSTFVWIFMRFSPKCRARNLGMIYTNLGSFGSFFN